MVVPVITAPVFTSMMSSATDKLLEEEDEDEDEEEELEDELDELLEREEELERADEDEVPAAHSVLVSPTFPVPAFASASSAAAARFWALSGDGDSEGEGTGATGPSASGVADELDDDIGVGKSLCLSQMPLRGPKQVTHFLCGRSSAGEYLAGPGQASIGIEITTENDHHVDVLADVALGCNLISRRALDAIPYYFAQPYFTHSLALGREEFRQMGKHPSSEFFYFPLRKNVNLFLPNG